jgi:hypothetical protein
MDECKKEYAQFITLYHVDYQFNFVYVRQGIPGAEQDNEETLEALDEVKAHKAYIDDKNNQDPL